MCSINIYWEHKKMDKCGGLIIPLRKRRVENRFTAMEWVTTMASLSVLLQAPDGAYPFQSDVIRRTNSGELKLKMNTKNCESTFGGR
jgi:hypothetical protein